MAADKSPLVTSVVQAAAVLRYLGSIDGRKGVTAVAKAVGIGRSSCFNILRTLVAVDLVTFDLPSKSYAIGVGAIDLARLSLRRDSAIAVAKEGMAKLAARFDAAVGLWRIASRDRLILIHLAATEAGTRIHLTVGQRQPIAAGATGRCVLAARSLSDEDIAHLYAGVRWAQRPTPKTYLRQVRQAEKRGYGVDQDELLRGISSVAAPIVEDDGTVKSCLSVTLFTGQYPPEVMPTIGEALRELAQAVGKASDA